MATLLFTDPLCQAHDPGPRHSESPQRLDAIWTALRELPEGARLVTSNRAARYEDLIAVHDPQYVDLLLARRGQRGNIDRETPFGPQSVDAACHAAGAGLAMIDALLDGAARRGFALVRPPGHHAHRDHGGGFCIFNNIAIASAHAARRGAQRILIVDWDVHHGNGTQAIFYDRREVFFFDVHQDGLYPDSGGADECGAGSGLGFTRNLPLLPLSGDDEYLHAIRAELLPIAQSYRPELILVSCGFDGLAGDPEGGMALTADGFARMTSLVADLADRFCGGRLGLFLEGGYLLEGLGRCARETIHALAAASRRDSDVNP